MFKRRGTIVQKLEDVEGPIRGSEVMLKSHAHVVGDIQCQHLSVERGAYFDGRSTCSPQTNMRAAPEKLTTRLRKENELKATREQVDASQLDDCCHAVRKQARH
jgi:cytoskeletal protein CcmA (bactofilin family)